jgi:5-methyltetrahydropteroyltriglutamate--homocysteine methyltransferase
VSTDRLIPTEQIGSIPRPRALVNMIRRGVTGPAFDALLDQAVRDTIVALEETGSPVITDGEQRKPSFATYPIQGSSLFTSGGVAIPFSDGHARRFPRLVAGPFRYRTHAADYVRAARTYTDLPVKQAVTSPSVLSLLYPPEGIEGYPREAFLDDIVNEVEADIRGCLDAGAHCVQIDLTEARLAIKLDPSRQLLSAFVDLNNRVLVRFSPEQRQRIGVHTCPGSDYDSPHSADVDYADLLPRLFDIQAGNFYVQLASERDPKRVLEMLRSYVDGQRRIFIGVVDPINPRVETPEEIRDRLVLAAKYIPPPYLGATDDCGFSPFCDDTSTTRETAFAKIRARVEGVRLAAEVLKM